MQRHGNRKTGTEEVGIPMSQNPSNEFPMEPSNKKKPEPDDKEPSNGLSDEVSYDVEADIEYNSMDKTQLSDVNMAAHSSVSKHHGKWTLGDFQVSKRLGQGAMATVFKAWQTSFGRKVALKILHRHAAEQPKILERFYREARTLGRLDHPNIVQGYSVGEAEGEHYFAMEYVSGKSLQQWILNLGRLSVGDSLFITLECAKGLKYAHKQGLVHRDVKPDNILITRYGEVKLADLGMVKSNDEDLSLTQTGHAVGTPWYMPLEQARNAKNTDQRSDIYALGCVLFCMLTGQPPFVGDSIVEVIRAKEIGTIPHTRKYNDEVPEHLDLILCKMTAKLPEDRYQNCKELIRDLKFLSLANTYLTFIHGKTKRKKVKTPLAPSSTPLPSTQLSPEQSSLDPDMWYVRTRDEDGNVVQKKMTTEDITNQVEDETLSPDSKASRYPDSGFRSLAAYKEFSKLTVNLALKKGADTRAAQYRELYKKLHEEDNQPGEETNNHEVFEDRIDFIFHRVLPISGIILGGLLLLGIGYWLARMLG